MKDGKRDGLYQRWYENGQLRFEGTYKDGKSNGLLRGWKSNGKLDWESTYKGGKLISDN
jgi:antitoxin component YwqK of YwqJK toxin-antitoxin module